jgi:Phenazine biosynthesis-like protein
MVEGMPGEGRGGGSEVEEIYLAKVFHHDSIPGNLTGVVVCPSPPRPRDCRFVARRLGLPDTCFVWKGGSGNWMHRTFSPYEELTFCTQTLLTGAATLQGIVQAGIPPGLDGITAIMVPDPGRQKPAVGAGFSR